MRSGSSSRGLDGNRDAEGNRVQRNVVRRRAGGVDRAIREEVGTSASIRRSLIGEVALVVEARGDTRVGEAEIEEIVLKFERRQRSHQGNIRKWTGETVVVERESAEGGERSEVRREVSAEEIVRQIEGGKLQSTIVSDTNAIRDRSSEGITVETKNSEPRGSLEPEDAAVQTSARE